MSTGPPTHPALPTWADWSPVAIRRPWTVGVEEEVMLLEATLAPAWRAEEILAALPATLAARVSAETHACVLELKTEPHATVAHAAAELAALRQALDGIIALRGVCAGVAGTHPLALWTDTVVSSGGRYRRIEETMRGLCAREPTLALHVHVAVPAPDLAARALHGMRRDLPLLLALAANSPFWQARDTGLASTRIPIFSMFPRTGLPPCEPTYDGYVASVDSLVGAGAVPDASFIWWDARLQPRFGTVEVRIMDAQTRLGDVAALTALVQCLVYRHARGEPEAAPGPQALAENRFLAARDGIAARLITPAGAHAQPAVDRLARVLWECGPIALELGCERELAAVTELVHRPGHARQRATASRRGLHAVLAGLATEFSGTRQPGRPRCQSAAFSIAEATMTRLTTYNQTRMVNAAPSDP
jgi:carboxylate-amine ligase